MCCYGECNNKRIKLMKRIQERELWCRECKAWICGECVRIIFSLDDVSEEEIVEEEGIEQPTIQHQLPEIKCSECESILTSKTITHSSVRLLSKLWSHYCFHLTKRDNTKLEKMLMRGCVAHYDGDTTGCSTRTKYFPSMRCPGCKNRLCERCSKYQSVESQRFCDRCGHRL